MKRLPLKGMRGLAGFFRPAPSFFDLAVTGILYINFICDSFKAQMFLIFYSILIICLSIMSKQQRQYSNKFLSLFMLWGFVSLFIHSYDIPKHSIVLRYINLYLMSEGFIYILFGGLFLITIVKYSRNMRIIWILAPLLILPWIRDYSIGASHKFTWICAIIISLLIYSILRKRLVAVLSILSISSIFIIKNFAMMKVRFACRPELIKIFLAQITEHPFIGTGFNKFLSPDNMIFSPYWGWLYRHNDILSITAYLGIPIFIIIFLFIADLTKKTGVNYRLILLLILINISFFQMTIVRPDKAVSYLLILGFIIIENIKNRRKYA